MSKRARVVKVYPLFEPGKRRLWHVCAMPLDVAQLCASAPTTCPPEQRIRLETPPEIAALIKRWSLAWSCLPDEARDMGNRIHAYLAGRTP